MKPEFSRTGAPVAAAELDALERRLGVSLPPRYRDFLLQHNGGRVRPKIFDIQDGCGGAVIQYFLSVGDPYPIEKWCADLKDPQYARMPPEYLPIAKCGTGDMVCIVVEGPKRGQIFFWDHEEEGYPEYTYDNLYFVASDIDALLEGLYDEPM